MKNTLSLPKLALIIIIATTNLTFAADSLEDSIRDVLLNVSYKSSINTREIMDDLINLERMVVADFDNKKAPSMVAALGTQRFVYSINGMNHFALDQIVKDSLKEMLVKTIYQTKVEYLTTLKTNDLLDNDDFNLYLHLLKSSQ